MKTTDLFRIALEYKLQETKNTQKQLAEAVGFFPNHISQYLTGAINFSENKRDKISEYFNMTSLEILNLGQEILEKNEHNKTDISIAKHNNPVAREKQRERKKYKLYLIVNIISYIAQKLLDDDCDTSFHKILKIIYFADQAHLVQYENPITFDRYFAMDHGPVASETYNLLKMIKGEDTLFFQDEFLDYLSIKDNHFVFPLQKADGRVLRKTARECIDTSIKENKSLNFKELRDKSHDAAYQKIMEEKENNGDILKRSTIPYHEIAKAGGADEGTINYIKMIQRWNM